MSPTFKDFSQRHILPVEAFAQPDSIRMLCQAVREAEAGGWPVHAVGSGWAFSAPSYCPGMVVQTDLLRRFPAGVQSAIVTPEPGDGRVLVAVEAGIKIRDLCLALKDRPRLPTLPTMQVTVDPEQQPLRRQITLTVSVSELSGEPIAGATVTISNFDSGGFPDPLTVTTDPTGLVSFPIAFNRRRAIDPMTHDQDVEWPSGEVTAEGFETATLPLRVAGGPTVGPATLVPGPGPDVGRGKDLWAPTLGGAAGQSLAGAVSTGTHGGDVARPPIGDYVRAMVLVGSGGRVRLLQRDGNPPVVDFQRLRSNLGNEIDPNTILDGTGTQAFDAAVLSVGRFGVVYAYVFEMHDESENFIYEHRSLSSWNNVKTTLATSYNDARARDEFFQVVVNPVRLPDGDRRCYITVQKKLPRSRVATAGEAFGLHLSAVPANLVSTYVLTERARPLSNPLIPWQWLRLAAIAGLLQHVFQHFHGSQPSPDVGALCADRLTPELERVRDQLRDLVRLAAFPPPTPGAEMFAAAADSIDKIRSEEPDQPDHKLGDVLMDALNAGPPEIVDQIISTAIDVAQRPWLVHGTRYEISDNFDYENDCYRGDSVEIFFAADDELPRKAELVFGVFDDLRARGTPLAAYASLRFLAPSKSLLGTAAFEPISCAIEISMLRGGRGNDRALAALQDIAIRNNGRIHWGQQNDLSARDVAAMYSDRYVRWCHSLEAVEGASPTFSNPFTKGHGLESTPFVAPPVPELRVSITPFPAPLLTPVELLVSAIEARSGTPVSGQVRISNFGGGGGLVTVEFPTNTPRTVTLRTRKGIDPATGEPDKTLVPTGTVTAPGFPTVEIDFGFDI